MPADRYAWTLETARALRAGNLAGVNMTEIAEELEQVGRSDARELESRVVQIMEHLLKLQLTRDELRRQDERGWQASIVRQQGEIRSLLKESPSLKRRLTDNLLADCYERAAAGVAKEHDVSPPEENPFTVTELLPELRGRLK